MKISHSVVTLFLIMWASSLTASELTVEIEGFKNDLGQAVLHLHSRTETFPTHPEGALKSATAAIRQGHSTARFHNLPEGTYAVAVYHDENNNGKLDKNFIGIPNEGLGVSNNAKGHFGPPRFSDASFTLNQPETNLTIRIQY